MAHDLQGLAAQAADLLAQSESKDAPVTQEDVARVMETAAQAVEQSRQEAGNAEDFEVEAFKPVSTSSEILREKLGAMTENNYTINKFMELFGDVASTADKIALTKNAREVLMDSVVSGIMATKNIEDTNQKVNAAAKKQLIAERELKYSAEEYEKHIVSTLGSTGKDVLDALPADEYINRVLDYKKKEQALFESWRKGAQAPVPAQVVAHRDYAQNEKYKRAEQALLGALGRNTRTQGQIY